MMSIVCPCCQLTKPFKSPGGAPRELMISCPQCGVRFSVHSTSGGGMRIECPKCRKVQPSGEACNFCGVIYRKFGASRQAVSEASTPQPPASSAPQPRKPSLGRYLKRGLAVAAVLVLIVGGVWNFHLWRGR